MDSSRDISMKAGAEVLVYKKRRQLPEIWRRFKKNRRAVLGGVILLIIFLLAILAPYITKYDPYTQDLSQMFAKPSWEHLCGTDNYGRDIFTRIIYGGRISLVAGIVSVSIAVLVGGTLGSIAGFFGGKIDNIIMRVMDIFLAIPSILLNISIVSALGSGLTNMLIAIGISYVPAFCRTLRAEILKVRGQEFIEAARTAGASNFLIIVKHVIPNCLAPLIVRATMNMASVILSCASLSFMGLGIQPPTAEWGSMLSSGREFIRTAPHLCTFPGLAIMLTIFSINLIGDGLRDALDPKMKT